MCEYLREIPVCALILQKWHPKSKLGEIWASLGEIWAKMVLEVL